jgi:hypothetical protein
MDLVICKRIRLGSGSKINPSYRVLYRQIRCEIRALSTAGVQWPLQACQNSVAAPTRRPRPSTYSFIRSVKRSRSCSIYPLCRLALAAPPKGCETRAAGIGKQRLLCRDWLPAPYPKTLAISIKSCPVSTLSSSHIPGYRLIHEFRPQQSSRKTTASFVPQQRIHIIYPLPQFLILRH